MGKTGVGVRQLKFVLMLAACVVGVRRTGAARARDQGAGIR